MALATRRRTQRATSWCLGLLVLSCGAPPPASSAAHAIVALTRVPPGLGTSAVDRGHAYWLEGSSRAVRLRREAAGGGSAENLARIRGGVAPYESWSLTVADRRAAVLRSVAGDLHQPGQYTLWAGDQRGPLQPSPFPVDTQPCCRFPAGPFLARDEVAYALGDPAMLTATAFAGGSRTLALAADADTVDVRAGRVSWVSGDEVVVADEHTGAPLRTLQIEGFPALTTGELSAWARLDVDGGVLVSVGHPGQDPIAWLAASASDTRLRELPLHSPQSRLTGGKLAYVASIPGGRRVVVRDLDARDRIVFRGPPSLDIRDLAIGDGVVAWSTPTCQLVAAFPKPVIRRLPAGPCPRSEATIRQVGPDSPVLEREATTMRVRCLTADSRACRVRLALRLLGHDYRLPGRLRVRVGRHRDVRIHVAPIVARCIRVIGASIEAISTDAHGRRHNRSGAGLGYEPEDSLAYQERRYVVICRAAREHLRSRR